MNKRPQGLQKTVRPHRTEQADGVSGIPVDDMPGLIQEFLYECEYRRHSSRTIEEEMAVLRKLLRFLRETNCATCSGIEMRRYLTSVANGEMQRGGRWGQKAPQQVKPRTVRNHWGYLRTFCNWVAEEHPAYPRIFDRIKPPIVRSDQIRPFTREQIAKLRIAAKNTLNPLRDEAIVLMLLDTGVRASELCSIKIRDLDLGAYHCSVLGKGNKRRLVYYGRDCRKSLWRLLQDREIHDDEPLFLSARGRHAGEPLTRAGLLQLIERLGKAAGLTGVRTSPHTFRHTYALTFLNGGGNMYSLQLLLGHTHLAMTQRYLNLAEGDLESQARRFSPVDSLRKKSND